jgi:hypothetical protein
MRRAAALLLLAGLTLTACGSDGPSTEERVTDAAARYFALLGSPDSTAKDCLKLLEPGGPADKFLRGFAKQSGGVKGGCGTVHNGVSPQPDVGRITIQGDTAKVKNRGGPTVLTLHEVRGKWLVVSFEQPPKKGSSKKNPSKSGA